MRYLSSGEPERGFKKLFLAVFTVSVLLLCWGCGGGSPPKNLQFAEVAESHIVVHRKLVYESYRLGLVFGMFERGETGELVVMGYGGNGVLFRSLGSSLYQDVVEPDQSHIVPPVSVDLSPSEVYIEADFDGDGAMDYIRPARKGGFILEDSKGSIIGGALIDRAYWFKPYVTWSQPHCLLVSTDAYLLVFDNYLQRVRTLPTPEITVPLHISAGCPLDGVRSGPFVSVFGGRGGWHRSIVLIHAPDNHVIYKEVLEDDCEAVWPLRKRDEKYKFLLGGRGQIWEYSFSSN